MASEEAPQSVSSEAQAEIPAFGKAAVVMKGRSFQSFADVAIDAMIAMIPPPPPPPQPMVEFAQSPVERALAILSRMQSSEGSDVTMHDVSFLRSTLYALQQSGIDDTNLIPSYLLSDDSEAERGGEAATHAPSPLASSPFTSSSSSSSNHPPTPLPAGISPNRSSFSLPISLLSHHSHRSHLLPPTGYNSPRLEAVPPMESPRNHTKEMERAVKTWLVSTYCRKRDRDERREDEVMTPRGGVTWNRPKSLSSGAVADGDGDVVVTDECASALAGRGAWRFNILEAKRTSPNFGFLLVSLIFEDWGLFHAFRLNKSVLRRFVQKLSLGYHPNPYHNFTHALDVFQTLHCLLRALPKDFYDSYEIFALLIAGLVHDLGHDGLNNSFHIRTYSQRALDHNDASPQENVHLVKFFSMLQKDEFNLFSVFDVAEYVRLRELIIHFVLMTDMTHHYELETQIKTFLKSKGVEASKETKDSKKMIGSALLHMADISNPSKTFSIAKYWACNIMEENYHQGLKEKELGLAVSPMCDVSSAVSIPSSQVGFINFVVLPFYSVMVNFLPNLGNDPFFGLNENARIWGTLDGCTLSDLVKCGAAPQMALDQPQPEKEE